MHCNDSSFLFKLISNVSSSYDEVNFDNSVTEAIVNKDLINKKKLINCHLIFFSSEKLCWSCIKNAQHR